MKPSLKYRLIEQHADKYPIDAMCKFYGISRSGYYRYKQHKGIPSRDTSLASMIAECQSTRGRIHGYRYIQLWLEKVKGIYKNPKTVLRIMRKYGLLSEVRRKRWRNCGQSIHRYENILDRNFVAQQPNKKWVTDISYIPTTQGFQYTSQAYFTLTQEYGITPSMSRRENPYDNALAENFFSMLKTECISRQKIHTFEQAQQLIDDYIHFYNFERYQLKYRLTPFEKRSKTA
ncbi:IS3 family transposase [uncultured Phascolarctobacterium sp.]|uniref:IS3 family transposase n=1 Tax=uncultured Phascolarctobacterium sp. TaxID=512296 RepID=UPI0025CBFD51|nr:IS3 family transposase [uncultured Phascolarctobacterium sp.]